MKKRILVTGILGVLLLAACAQVEPSLPETSLPQDTEGLVYINSVDVLVMESFPVQVRVVVSGDLPSPCHEYGYTYEINQRFQTININLFSTQSDPGSVCIAVLDPFEISISLDLDGLPDGEFEIWLNGELVGSFSYPG